VRRRSSEESWRSKKLREEEAKSDRVGGDEVQEKICGKREETLISGYEYHVMNNTCIHLRTGGPNIYMYMKGKYTKK
jgi:hypothetical protein